MVTAAIPLAISGGCGDDTGPGGGGGAGSGGGASGCAQAHPECTALHQKGDGKTLYSANGLGFEVDEQLGEAALPDVVVVSPQTNGTVKTGTTKLIGMDGLVVSFVSVDAVTDLINYDGRVPGPLYVGTSGTATIDQGIDYGSQFQARVAGTLANVVYQELDDNYDVIEGGKCLCLDSGTFDAADRDIACGAPAAAPSGSCFDWQMLGHDCSPFTNEGCMPGEICDFGGYFKCYPLDGSEVDVCATCNNDTGPHCLQGATCDGNNDDGKCTRFCCTDADCGTGGSCVAYAIGGATNLGICLTQ